MNEQVEAQSIDIVELAADLVAAYVSNNNVPMSELPGVIASIHATLSGLGNAAPAELVGPEKATPAQVRKSITPDALISFVDGKRYKTLKRHLTGNGMTFEEYRARYGLPSDYPSTSPNYSAQRSELAKSTGLGQQRRKAALKVVAGNDTVAEAPKARGRKPKAVEAPEAAPKARNQKKKVAEPA